MAQGFFGLRSVGPFVGDLGHFIMIESSGPMSPFGFWVLCSLQSNLLAGACWSAVVIATAVLTPPFFFQLMVPLIWRNLRNSEGILLFFLFRVLFLVDFLVGGFNYNYTHTRKTFSAGIWKTRVHIFYFT